MNDELPTQTPASAIERELPLADDGTVTKSGTDPDPPGQPPGTHIQSPEAAARAASESVDPWHGIVVEGYEIAGEVGHGAMGVVYKARHVSLNRLVALKMTGERRAGEKELIRFLAEAEAVAAVEHRNVVRVYDYGQSGGRPYMALEFCSGGSLAEHLQRGGLLAPGTAAAMVGRIAAGVAAAHERGIVHRDLKPGNVLLAEDGEPKVADFGIAKRIGRDLTATQAVMGTPAYMAPEQAGGKAKFVGPPADVWALGVILYECLTGTKPFTGDTAEELLADVRTSTPPDPYTPGGAVPRDLKLIYRKCLEKNPADRYPTARELADDLARFGRGEPISVRPLSAPVRAARWARRNPVVAGLMALVVLTALGLIGSLYAQNRSATAQLNAERDAKEKAERLVRETAQREEAERLQREAELRATRSDAEAAQAILRATHSATEAAQANVLAELLDTLFRSSDPLVAYFGDSVPGLGVATAGGAQGAAFKPTLLSARDRIRATLTDPSAVLVRAKLLASIGNAMKNLGMLLEAKEVLAEALALRRANLPARHPDLWRTELDMGQLEGECGDLQTALNHFRNLYQLQKREKADEDTLLKTRLYEGAALAILGYPEAETALKEVARAREDRSGKSDKGALLAKLALVGFYLDQRRWKELAALAAQLREDVGGVPDAQMRKTGETILDCQTLVALGKDQFTLSLSGGPLELSKKLKVKIGDLEQLLPENHFLLSLFRFELALLLIQARNLTEADALYARVLKDVRNTVTLAHHYTHYFISVYSLRLTATGRVADARLLFEEAENATRERFGSDSAWLTSLLLRRAWFENNQRNFSKVLECIRRATELLKQGKYVGKTIPLEDAVQLALLNEGSPELLSARKELLTALIGQKSPGMTNEERVSLFSAEGILAYRAKDYPAARDALEKARALLPSTPDIYPPVRIRTLYHCGYLDLFSGRWANAESHFRAALAISRRIPNELLTDRLELNASVAVALSLQGRYKEAVPLFEEDVRLMPGLNTPEWNVAFSEMRVAVNQLAGGDREAYRMTLAKMFGKYFTRGRHVDTLTRLAWVGGLNPVPEGWNPAEFEAAFTAALRSVPQFAWGYRGLALVRLRAGKFPEIEEALAHGGIPHPVDHLIRGLAAAALNDLPAARAHLAKAEELIESQQPSEQNPYVYAGYSWNQLVETAILLAELREALAPPVAPPPREK